jgi:hypothetical protein
MALLAVVTVLIVLVLIATPFALQMQSQDRRSEALLYTEEAEQEARNLFAVGNLYLLSGVAEIERERAGKNEKTFATPDYDTAEEFEFPAEQLHGFNENSARGRIWDLRIEDEQAKINVTSAPPGLLANLLGSTTLARDVEDSDTTIRVTDASVLPEKNGLVRIGGELIRYQEVNGTTLTGVQRGLGTDKAWNLPADAHRQGTLVMNAAAFEMATYAFRIEEGQFRPFRNPYQVKRVAELGVTTLEPERFERIADQLTCYSGSEVPGGWCNAQTIRSTLLESAGGSGAVTVAVDNPTYFGIDTVVRITDGINSDYGIVTDVKGTLIYVGTELKHDYESGRARIEGQARQPVNVNTASLEVLTACLENIQPKGRPADAVTAEMAREIATRLKAAPVKSLFMLKELLLAAQNEGVITQVQKDYIYANALNPQDARLGFSTVPFSFVSYDTYTMVGTAVVNSKVGEEIARKSVRRVISVNPRQSTVFRMETQEEFENQINASRDAKYFTTFPYNVGGAYEGYNIPPSRFAAHMRRGIWPSTSREPGIGDVRLQPERMDLAGVFHYDDSHYSEGYYIKDGALTYSTRQQNLLLVDNQGRANPPTISFWFKPYWGGLGSTAYLVDTGEDDFRNRIAAFYDSENRELVFRVADATLENRASEIRYAVDNGEFLDETWYHVSVSAGGSKPSDLTLLVDGRVVGESSYMSRLRANVAATGEVSELSLDNADTFPESGAVIVRGPEGPEVFEYNGRSSGSLSVTKRFARLPTSTVNSQNWAGLSHETGALVELLGYAQPLLTDIPRGGSTLAADLSPWHALRVVYGEDMIYIPPEQTGGGGGGGLQGANQPPPGILTQAAQPAAPAPVGGDNGGNNQSTAGTVLFGISADRQSVDLTPGQGIEAWDTGISTTEALLAFGTAGYAILVSPEFDLEGRTPEPNQTVGGSEIVTYQKMGTGLRITRYQVTKQKDQAAPAHFVPQHSYGNVEATVQWTDGTPGLPTALIPISIQGSGSSLDYFDAIDDADLQDTYLNISGQTGVYAQIGTEWFAYCYPDSQLDSGSTIFVWDAPNRIDSVTSRFGGGRLPASSGDTGGTDQPTDPDGDTPTDPPDDQPGPAPEPGAPPEPDDPGSGSGGDVPVPPPPEGEDDNPGDGTGAVDPPPPPGGEDDTPGDGSGAVDPPPPPSGEDDTPGTGTGDTPPEPSIPGEDDTPGGGGSDVEPPPGGEDTPPTAEPPTEVPPDGGGSDGGDGSSGGTSNARGTPGPDVPAELLEELLAGYLAHRPRGDFTIRDTYEEFHSTGDEIRPAFLVAAYDGYLPGYDDVVTIANNEGAIQETRLQHGSISVAYRVSSGDQVAKAPVVQSWVAMTSFVKGRIERTENGLGSLVEGTADTRDLPRLLKFPSGELPDALGDTVYFGGRYDGSTYSPGILDEMWSRRNVNFRLFFLGDGDSLADADSERPDVLESETALKIHMWPTSGNTDGLPLTGLPEDGGVLRIGDELIAYQELDTSTGELEGVERGVLGTEAKLHSFGARVSEAMNIPVATLAGGVTASASEIPINKMFDFPRTTGYVKIDEEIIGYTSTSGNTLIMPQGLLEEQADGTPGVGSGIFRSRFGTLASDHADGAFVYQMPSRFPDRYQERSADPQVASIILRKRVDGAIWKRISWDEHQVPLTVVKVFARFDGTPNWDSSNIYSVQDQMVASGRQEEFNADPKSFLFRIDRPYDLNRLNIQADVVEIRILYQYEAGAYDVNVAPPANSWKDTPWLKAVRAEYIAPVTIHYSEEVR